MQLITFSSSTHAFRIHGDATAATETLWNTLHGMRILSRWNMKPIFIIVWKNAVIWSCSSLLIALSNWEIYCYRYLRNGNFSCDSPLIVCAFQLKPPNPNQKVVILHTKLNYAQGERANSMQFVIKINNCKHICMHAVNLTSSHFIITQTHICVQISPWKANKIDLLQSFGMELIFPNCRCSATQVVSALYNIHCYTFYRWMFSSALLEYS